MSNSTKPSIPTCVIISAGASLSFATKDEELHMNNVADIETYTLGKDPLVIPIIDTGLNSIWNGAGITIGNNAKVFRDWFRSEKKDVLLWDKARPPGSELGIYHRL